MSKLRRENTEKGREMWRAVDSAASRAPKWAREQIKAQSDVKGTGQIRERKNAEDKEHN